MKKTLIAFSLCLFFASVALAQSDGISYKIPGGVFTMDWNKSGFRGMLFLEKDSPSGLFITYPNDNESIEALTKRATNFIAPMVSDANRDAGDIKFETSALPSRGSDPGTYFLYQGAKSKMQIILYIREKAGKKLIYGYFAQGGIKKSKWADDQGKGVKLLDKFVKTFE